MAKKDIELSIKEIVEEKPTYEVVEKIGRIGNITNLAIREQADMKSKIIGYVKADTYTITKIENYYAYIPILGGWVSTKFIDFV